LIQKEQGSDRMNDQGRLPGAASREATSHFAKQTDMSKAVYFPTSRSPKGTGWLVY
jgi:hypothetical protein